MYVRVAEPPDRGETWPGPHVSQAQWAPGFDLERQSQLTGSSDGIGHFVDMPIPNRIILFGERMDQNLVRIIRGITRLSGVTIARARLTPDAGPDGEFEIENVTDGL